MKQKSNLSGLISKIKNSQKETVKAVAYSEGYLDCIKDILNESSNTLVEIMNVKYDGKVRGEVYAEILPMLEELENQEKTNSAPSVVLESVVSESEMMHPSDRARSFLERIGRA